MHTCYRKASRRIFPVISKCAFQKGEGIQKVTAVAEGCPSLEMLHPGKVEADTKSFRHNHCEVAQRHAKVDLSEDTKCCRRDPPREPLCHIKPDNAILKNCKQDPPNIAIRDAKIGPSYTNRYEHNPQTRNATMDENQNANKYAPPESQKDKVKEVNLNEPDRNVLHYLIAHHPHFPNNRGYSAHRDDYYSEDVTNYRSSSHQHRDQHPYQRNNEGLNLTLRNDSSPEEEERFKTCLILVTSWTFLVST